MNIKDYMGGLAETPVLSDESLDQLIQVRMKTFFGFMEREHSKGIMFAPFDLRTPKGQDVARLLFWRCIEEYAEAINSKDIEHRLEELIDAFNYAAAGFAATNDTDKSYKPTVKDWDPWFRGEDPTEHRLGKLSRNLANVTETFRNRAWMENAQSSYFDGLGEYRAALLYAMKTCAAGFHNWDEFWRFFMAKDAVLQFRLKSNY